MKSILLVAGAGLATAVSAANVSWTGAAGDGQWGTAGNWSTDTVPTSADVAVFAKATLPSGAVVKLGADQQVGAIQFSDDVQNVTFDGKTGESRHALTLTGGGITGKSNKKTIATFDCDVYLSRPASVRGEYTGNLRFLGRFGSAADAQTPVDISFDGVQNGNAYLIGTVVAALSGIVAIRLLKTITAKGGFGKFCYYCWGAGFIAVVLSIIL